MEKNIRQSNFELLRIILMLLIIAHHYSINSGFSNVFDFDNISVNVLFVQFISFGGKVEVNGFFY